MYWQNCEKRFSSVANLFPKRHGWFILRIIAIKGLARCCYTPAAPPTLSKVGKFSIILANYSFNRSAQLTRNGGRCPPYIYTTMKAYISIKYRADNSNKDCIEKISSALERNGFETVCIARDIEKWERFN